MSEPVEVKIGTPKIDLVLEYARGHAMGEADLLALQRLFWKIWAHPDLIAFPLVAASLREILELQYSRICVRAGTARRREAAAIAWRIVGLLGLTGAAEPLPRRLLVLLERQSR
jgi:hypothetical protein